jgi:hypothetical protein
MAMLMYVLTILFWNMTAYFRQDETIQKQMAVLNNTFGPHRITFNLLKTTRTINARWANGLDDLEKKKALREGDYKTLNLYYQKAVLQGSDRYIGYCHFPTNVQPGSDQFYRDGCIVQFDSMPGLDLQDLNTGKITTHEVGHWFNLFHTFQGGCFGDGDGIDDTPAEAVPGSGCPIGRDTCGSPGLDPIHNHMDYTVDVCRTQFTKGQEARIFSSWEKYRANA